MDCLDLNIGPHQPIKQKTLWYLKLDGVVIYRKYIRKHAELSLGVMFTMLDQ